MNNQYQFNNGQKSSKRNLDSNNGDDCSVNKRNRETSEIKIDEHLNECFGFFLNHLSIRPCNKSDFKALTLKSLLSEINGKIIESIFFSYKYDIEWLMEQFPKNCCDKPIDIVFDSKFADELMNDAKLFPNINLCPIKLPGIFSCHHTKMIILRYDDQSIRIIILTANIYPMDWYAYTQGIWISPKLTGKTNLDTSKTNFKTDLIEYLNTYENNETINKWINLINEYDFSPINVYLIGSTPNYQKQAIDSFGHMKLRKILKNSEYAPTSEIATWQIICQFSSIGSLGPTAESWLTSSFAESLSAFNDNQNNQKQPLPEIKCMYPTVNKVLNSVDETGSSLPYSNATNQKQKYLHEYLYQYQSLSKLNRNDVMGHIKTYARISNDNKQVAWFLLTSKNLSKAAWGYLVNKNKNLRMTNYELGILFLPKLLINANTFDIGERSFPIPYNLPLVKYKKDDKPWTHNIF